MNKIKRNTSLTLIALFSMVLIAGFDNLTSSGYEGQVFASESTASETAEMKQYSTESFNLTNTDADLNSLARKYIPAGAKIVHTVVSGKFAQSASENKSGNVVVNYKGKSDYNAYSTMVLVPQRGNSWNSYQLPLPDVTWAFMEPQAVFFYNVDKDSDLELLILEQAESGAGPTGAVPFYRTRIYDWQRGGFKHLDKLSDKIDADANTVAKVRKELRKIIK